MPQLNNIIYPRPQNIVLGQGAFSVSEMQDTNYLQNTIVGSLKTRHLGFDFTTDEHQYMDDMANHFVAYVCIKPFIINFTDFSRDSILNTGDYIAFPSECSVSADIDETHYIKFNVFYWPIIESKPSDANTYKITATLTDKYEIQITANSEKEAYDKAYNTPLSHWKHITPGGIAKPRKIIRWAEWGNFKIKD